MEDYERGRKCEEKTMDGKEGEMASESDTKRRYGEQRSLNMATTVGIKSRLLDCRFTLRIPEADLLWD